MNEDFVQKRQKQMKPQWIWICLVHPYKHVSTLARSQTLATESPNIKGVICIHILLSTSG